MMSPQLGEAIASDYEEALAFAAPYLIDKVIEEALADTAEEADALFLEVKRYLVMTHACLPRWGVPSNSCRIDEVWHNFVLFTREYAAYCQQYFGRFMNHAPSNAPPGPVRETPALDPDRPKSFPEHYASFFGIELPDLWRDELNVTVSRRAIGKKGSLSGVAANGQELLVVEKRRVAAMQFIQRGLPFFVRELPGELSDEEKCGLVSTLIERRLVRIY